eukprot:164718-Amphidinium_carterae.1
MSRSPATMRPKKNAKDTQKKNLCGKFPELGSRCGSFYFARGWAIGRPVSGISVVTNASMTRCLATFRHTLRLRMLLSNSQLGCCQHLATQLLFNNPGNQKRGPFEQSIALIMGPEV